MKVLFLVNGFPSYSNPSRCPFNLKAYRSLSCKYDLTVVVVKTFNPFRSVKKFSLVTSYEYEGVEVNIIYVPYIPRNFRKSFTGGYSLINMYARFVINLLQYQLFPHFKNNSYSYVHNVSLSLPLFSLVRLKEKYHFKYQIFTQLIGGDVNSANINLFNSNLFTRCLKHTKFIANSISLINTFSAKSFVPSNEIFLAYRGVNLPPSRPNKRTFFNRSHFTIGYAGGYINKTLFDKGIDLKGADIFFKSLAILDEVIPNNITISVNLAGPHISPNLTSICTASFKNIKFMSHGALSFDDMPTFFISNDFIVIPSRNEGLPNVCLEAMSFGCIIIASDVGGIPEVVLNEFNGFIFERENHNSLSDYLFRCIMSEFDLSYISDNAINRIYSKFNSNFFEQSVTKAYLSV